MATAPRTPRHVVSSAAQPPPPDSAPRGFERGATAAPGLRATWRAPTKRRARTRQPRSDPTAPIDARRWPAQRRRPQGPAARTAEPGVASGAKSTPTRTRRAAPRCAASSARAARLADLRSARRPDPPPSMPAVRRHNDAARRDPPLRPRRWVWRPAQTSTPQETRPPASPSAGADRRPCRDSVSVGGAPAQPRRSAPPPSMPTGRTRAAGLAAGRSLRPSPPARATARARRARPSRARRRPGSRRRASRWLG